MNDLRVISYGGGVQSTAMLVLAAERRIDFPYALFANVGDDSENPSTLEYVRNVAQPFAARHGIELEELHRQKRDGAIETLYGRLTGTNRSITIPMRRSRTGAPAARNCTVDFKIKVMVKWHKAHGATAEHPSVAGIGISMDEIHRARTSSGEPTQLIEYPLLTLRLDRADCVALIRKAGLPIPSKSSCFFCPYKRVAEWKRMRQEEPDLFWKSVALEQTISDRAVSIGQGPVTMSDRMKPLTVITGPEYQHSFTDDWGDDACNSGVCMT